jgi:hypothetical protein
MGKEEDDIDLAPMIRRDEVKRYVFYGFLEVVRWLAEIAAGGLRLDEERTKPYRMSGVMLETMSLY